MMKKGKPKRRRKPNIKYHCSGCGRSITPRQAETADGLCKTCLKREVGED